MGEEGLGGCGGEGGPSGRGDSIEAEVLGLGCTGGGEDITTDADSFGCGGGGTDGGELIDNADCCNCGGGGATELLIDGGGLCEDADCWSSGGGGENDMLRGDGGLFEDATGSCGWDGGGELCACRSIETIDSSGGWSDTQKGLADTHALVGKGKELINVCQAHEQATYKLLHTQSMKGVCTVVSTHVQAVQQHVQPPKHTLWGSP